MWHFLYIITPDSSIPSARSLTTKFVIQVTVVYLGYLVLAGLVVSFLLYLLRNRLQDIERGEKRDYYYLTNHIVIVGSRDYLWKLIEHIENSQEQKTTPEWLPRPFRNLVFIPYCFHKNWIEKILCVSEPYMPPKGTLHDSSQQNDDDDEVHYLPREFYTTGQEIPILVRQEAGAGLMHALHYTKTHNYAKVLPFGMRLDEFDLVQKDNDRSATISRLVYRNTQRLHQDKRSRKDFTTYRERDKVVKNVEEFFDVGKSETMKWNDLSMRLKFANRYRSYLLWSYLRSLGKTNFKCKTQVELDGDMRHLRDTLMYHGKMMAEVEHNRWNVEQLLLGKLPRPTLNTEENDGINDIVPYKDLKAINPWRRINLTLFLYLPVKYYLEAEMLRQQKEEAEKEEKERRR